MQNFQSKIQFVNLSITTVFLSIVIFLMFYYNQNINGGVFTELKSTFPDSAGKRAAIERARQLTDFKWTPLKNITTYTKSTGQTALLAGVEVTGMPYSSLEPTDKFIYENVSFETLLSAMANPDSVLYTKDIGGRRNSWVYYGIVCNGLVRYALQINRRISTKRWGTVPGMRKIADRCAYTFEDIKLCDVIYAFGLGRNHVEIVTDLLRDEDGRVVKIELSGAVFPHCKRRTFTEEEYFKKFELFELWRYDYIDDVPDIDKDTDAILKKGVSPVLPKIAVDNGNKSNYFYGNETVISVFADGENKIVIYKNGNLSEVLTVSGAGKIVRKFEPGYYKVILNKEQEVLEFAVNLPKITHEVADGKLTVHFDSCDTESEILYADFRENIPDIEGTRISLNSDISYYDSHCSSLSRLEELSEKEKKAGQYTRDIPEDAGYFKLYFKNKYGVWTHRMIKI